MREVHAEPVLLVTKVDEQREQKRQPHPGPAPEQCLADWDHVRFAVEHPEIERQQDHDETDETEPQPFHDHLREPRRTEAARSSDGLSPERAGWRRCSGTCDSAGAKAQRQAGQRTRGATPQINARVEPSLARGLTPQQHQRVEMVRALAARHGTMCSGACSRTSVRKCERTCDQGRPAGRRGKPLSGARWTATGAVKEHILGVLRAENATEIAACGDGRKVIVDACPTNEGKQQQITEKKAVPVHPAFHRKESGPSVTANVVYCNVTRSNVPTR